MLVRSQAYLIDKAESFINVEDASQQEVSLRTGDQGLEDQLVLIDFILRKGVFKADLIGNATGLCTVAILNEAFASLNEFVHSSETRPFIQLT